MSEYSWQNVSFKWLKYLTLYICQKILPGYIYIYVKHSCRKRDPGEPSYLKMAKQTEIFIEKVYQTEILIDQTEIFLEQTEI